MNVSMIYGLIGTRFALRFRRPAIDDGHDYDGNSLYRLQFPVTIMPGQRKGKLALARMTVRPPDVSPEKIADLYYTWLGHM
jgi:hypothetical protein